MGFPASLTAIPVLFCTFRPASSILTFAFPVLRNEDVSHRQRVVIALFHRQDRFTRTTAIPFSFPTVRFLIPLTRLQDADAFPVFPSQIARHSLLNLVLMVRFLSFLCSVTDLRGCSSFAIRLTNHQNNFKTENHKPNKPERRREARSRSGTKVEFLYYRNSHSARATMEASSSKASYQ